PEGTVLDWGCGSGIAGRAFVGMFGAERVSRLHCADRSTLAVRYATRRAREKHPGLDVAAGGVSAPVVLLLSHVLPELSPGQTESLLSLAEQAQCVLWVEPGDYESSLALIAVRERLRECFEIVAPCPHRHRCGVLEPGNESHWCHHFATPPGFVFHDADWSRFANEMEIDLRSLPVSYLVLDRRPAPVLPADAVRILGRPRVEKPFARVLACHTSGELTECHITKRRLPAVYHRFRKGRWDSLQSFRRAGGEIESLHDVLPVPAGPNH
ncbi:MAG: hypothetical protein KDM81_19890, partial [Verrucomicrobiae bacterium]|nr:hypothetical protein [Verrucomicrobiae bacterium]